MRAAGFAIYYHPEGYTLAGKIMGRQAAGAAFVRAIAKACLPRLWCYSASREFAVRLANQLADLGAKKTGVAMDSNLGTRAARGAWPALSP